VLDALKTEPVEILYSRHYREYDTYFGFEDPDQGYLRHREDEYIDENGEVTSARYRLTLIGPAREGEFPSAVLLSRSRYLATASHSLRFYREYFKPTQEIYIEKDRLRWRVIYRDTTFYINLDRVDKPDLGYFLEVKSRTWSRKDADNKSAMVAELIQFLGGSPDETVTEDYVQTVERSAAD
jgi:5-methylthioadenosine/S-adenosylhomocysteine deaminase